MTPTDALLAAGMVARLTRFVTRDDLGHWVVKAPLEGVALRASAGHVWDADDVDTWPVPLKAAHGLSCPWCVSVWLGLAVYGSHAAAGRLGVLSLWRWVGAALSTSYVAGFIESRQAD